MKKSSQINCTGKKLRSSSVNTRKRQEFTVPAQVDAAVRVEGTCTYIAEITKELTAVAASAERGFLAYLLSLAADEATAQSRQVARSNCA